MGKRQNLTSDQKVAQVPAENVKLAISNLKELAKSIIVDERFSPDNIEHITRDKFDKRQKEANGSKSRGNVQALSDRFQDRDFTGLVVAETNLHNIQQKTLTFCEDLEKEVELDKKFTAYDVAGLEDAKSDLEKLTTHHYEYQNYEHRRTRGELSKKEGRKHKVMGGLTSEIIFTAGQLAAVGLVHTGFQYGSRLAIIHATATGVIDPDSSVKEAIEKFNAGPSEETTAMTTAEMHIPSTLQGTVASAILSEKTFPAVTEQLISQTQTEMERVGATDSTQLSDTSLEHIATNIAVTTVLPTLSREDVTAFLQNGASSSVPADVPTNYDDLSVKDRMDFLETLPDFSVSSSYLPNDAFPKGNKILPTIADFVIASIRNTVFTRLDFSYEAEKQKQQLENKLNPKPKSEHPKLDTFIDSFRKSAHRQVYNALVINFVMSAGFAVVKAALDDGKDKETQQQMTEFVESVGVTAFWSVITGVANATIDAGRSIVNLGTTGQQLLKIAGRVGVRGALQFGKGVVLDAKGVAKAGIEALILGVGSGVGKELISAGIIIGKEKYALPVGKNPSLVANYISTLAEIGMKHKSNAVVNLIKKIGETIPGNNTFEIVNPHRYETPQVIKPVYIQSPMDPGKEYAPNLESVKAPEALLSSRSDHLEILNSTELESVVVHENPTFNMGEETYRSKSENHDSGFDAASTSESRSSDMSSRNKFKVPLNISDSKRSKIVRKQDPKQNPKQNPKQSTKF